MSHAADTDIVINEIMYHPASDNHDHEYIELYNNGPDPVDLSGWVLSSAVNMLFPLNTIMPPDSYLVICRNEAVVQSFYGITNTVGNYFDDKLNNSGEPIVLKNTGNVIIDLVTYSDGSHPIGTDPWPTEADGAGASLELFLPGSDNAQAANWGVGKLNSPGVVNDPVFAGGGDVVITEIMYQPEKKRFMENLDPRHGGYWWEDGDDPAGEYLEIYNRGGQTEDLSGWEIIDSTGVLFTFPPGTILATGDYLAVCQDVADIASNYQIVNVIGNLAGKLSNDGERLTLLDSNDVVIDTVRYRDEPPWPLGPDQVGQSLELLDPLSNNDRADNWRACRVPEPNNPELVWEPDPGDAEWTYYEASCSATSNRFYFYILGSGEWLVDEVKVFAAGNPGTNIMENGSFEPDDAGWDKTGNHSGCLWTSTDFHDGSGCERIISTGVGGSNTNSLNRYVSTVTAGQNYTISFWAKHVSGAAALRFRLSGSGCLTDAPPPSGGDLHVCQSPLVYFVGTETFVTRGTPGAANSVSSVGIPPLAQNLAHTPLKPTSAEAVTVTAVVSGNDPISSVTLDYEVFVAPYNEPNETVSMAMNDQGLDGDALADDGIYTAQISARGSQSLVRYRVTATDTGARSWTWPDAEEPNPNRAYFVYNGEGETNLNACFLIMRQDALDTLAATVNMYNTDPWNPDFKRYVKAALVIDGIVYDNIRTRYRADRNHAKHAYKFQFNKTEYFRNMRSLDTDFQAPISQDVASNMFTLVGQINIALVPIRLYLNGSYGGVLVLQESPNSSWLREMGLDDNSEIYKAKSSSGCASGFLPCLCIPSVCWCSIGSSLNSNLSYYPNLDDYSRMYIKRSDSLGSFQSLQDYTLDLQSANTTYLETNTEVYNWIYKTIIHSMHGHLDYHAKNFYIVRSPDPVGKWDVFYFDYDMFWGCKAFGGSCYGTTADPKGSGTVMQSRIYGSGTYNNMFLLILKDVAENILTEEVVSDMLDQAFADTAVDRQEEIDTVAGASVTTDARMADMKQHFIDRRNWLVNTYLPAQNITPLANEHPYITVDEPNMISANEVVISWTWTDAEADTCLVDLYWTDLGFNHFVPIPDANDLPAGVGGHSVFTWTQEIPDMVNQRIYIHAVIRDGNGPLVGRSTSGFVVPVPIPPLPGDVDDSGMVDVTDLTMVLESWLDPPEPNSGGPMTTWDLEVDYSATENPNGAWSYLDSSGQLLSQAPSGTIGGGLPGWEGVGGLPSFFQGPWNFATADQFVSHGPLMVRWTSPLLGDIQISGGGLAPDWELSRLMHWQWRLNNIIIAEGDFPPNYSYVDFADGLIDPSVLVQSVLPGDQLDFVCEGSGPNSTSTFFGFKFQIEQLSGSITELVPEELDLVRDNKINLLDFSVISAHWMETAGI